MVHLATANIGPLSAANGHRHSNGGRLDAAALRQPPSYAADGGRASPALPLPRPPANPFEQTLSPAMTPAGMDRQQAGLHHGGLGNGQQRQADVVTQSARLEGSQSAPVDFVKEQSSSVLRDDGTLTWSEPDAAFQVSCGARVRGFPGRVYRPVCLVKPVCWGAKQDMPRRQTRTLREQQSDPLGKQGEVCTAVS